MKLSKSFENHFRFSSQGFNSCFINKVFSLKMQEPQRYNLLSCLQKSMKAAQKRVYLHRIIYIGSYEEEDSPQDEKALAILVDSNIKLINEDYCEDIITGFGLFYTGYFINITEGPESTLLKHMKTLLDTFDEDLTKTPTISKMKVLLTSFHINKRFFSSWNGRVATPPVLLDKIEPTSVPEINTRYIQNCVMKLYRMSEYLKNQRPSFINDAMDNVSELCQQHLPEAILLDFLLDSPALMDVREFVSLYGSMPKYTIYHECIWPLPSDFVPYHIFAEEGEKKLMSYESKETLYKEGEKEGDQEKETHGNED